MYIKKRIELNFDLKKCFKKLSLFILSLSIFIGSMPAHAEVLQCSRVLSPEANAVQSENLKTFTNNLFENELSMLQSWSDRALFQLMRGSIYKKVKAQCSSGECLESDVARIVELSIMESFEKYDKFKSSYRKMRGYALLAGASVGVAISSFYIKGKLPAGDQWISDFITITSSIVLYKLGAPLLDYYGGVMFRGAFRLEKGKSFFREASEMSRYDQKYRNLQEKMTPWEQQETTRIMSVLNTAESTLSAMLESIQSKDPSKGGIERASARIAHLAIKFRKFFPEIPADDPDLIRAVNMTFTQYLWDDGTRETLYFLIMDQIEKNDPSFHEVKKTEYYKKSIGLWTGLELIY